MRTNLFIAALSLAAALLSAAPRGAAAEPADFVSWALERGTECDARWVRIVGLEDAKSAPSGAAQVETGPTRRGAFVRPVSGALASADFCSASRFSREAMTDAEHLPLSTRERDGVKRGAVKFEHYSHMHLGGFYDRLRPINSSIQQRKVIRSFGSPTRPKLDSFGRFSQSSRTRSAARPSSGLTRPHKW